jgi:predicted enzyme related to lactoylglutathione lyase
MTIFSVADTDAAVAKAGELGATVVAPPGDIEGVGRFAVLTDPQGVYFGVIATAAA